MKEIGSAAVEPNARADRDGQLDGNPRDALRVLDGVHARYDDVRHSGDLHPLSTPLLCSPGAMQPG